jgi:hypothetical protein
MDICRKLEDEYSAIIYPITTKMNQANELLWCVVNYRLIWLLYTQLVQILKLYKPIIGMDVVFAKGSPVFNKLQNTLEYGNTLIDNLAR